MKRDIKHSIEYKIELIKYLAEDVCDTLDSLDTETVDKMELYEPLVDSPRRNFYDADRAMYRLERYFNDERWDSWSTFRNEERSKNA